MNEKGLIHLAQNKNTRNKKTRNTGSYIAAKPPYKRFTLIGWLFKEEILADFIFMCVF